jgi:hypothetical protein
MKAVLTFLHLSLLTLSSTVLAGDVSGIIDRITIVNDVVFLKTYPEPPTREACSSNVYWHYAFPLNSEGNKGNLSLALSAYATKSPVTIRSRDTCTHIGDLEDINYIILESQR